MIDVILDSSILIGITHIYLKNMQSPRDRREQKLFEIKEMLEDRKINCIVTPTIKSEILKGWRHDDGLGEKVINRFCEISKFDEYSEGKALQLTDCYGNYPINGVPAIVNAEDYLQPNYCDASIVAETSVEQKRRNKVIPLITDNVKDVCDFNKINQINKRNNAPLVHIFSMYTLKDAIELAKKNDNVM